MNDSCTEKLPGRLKVEISNRCNIRCKECLRSASSRANAVMPLERFVHLFDQVRPYRLNLTGEGETLLNPDLLRMIAYARENGTEHIRFFTNGLLLDATMADELVRLEVDCVNFSVDGASKERYESIRQGSSFPKVLDNIKGLVEAKRHKGGEKPFIGLKFVIFNENIDEVGTFVELCGSQFGREVEPEFLMLEPMDIPSMRALIPSIGAETMAHLVGACRKAEQYGYLSTVRNLRHIISHLPKKYCSTQAPCFHPVHNLTVTVHGDVVPCQLYYDDQLILGNVFQEPVEAIWNSEKYRRFRERIRCRRDGTGLCHFCVDTEEDEDFYLA